MKKKKIISALLVTALLFGGCGNGMEPAGESSGAVTNEPGVSGAADEPITITIAKQLDENAGRYEGNDDLNNNPMTRLTEEKLGIKIDTVLLGGDATNYDTKLRLALTGAEQLPDVFPVYSTQMIADMIESGQVKAIDDDIEKYMPDRIKEIYNNFPQTYYPIMKDGKTYGIANCPVLDDTQVLIIRQDWLDNLGLSAPTNIEEFEAVIKAFTEDDPDGNGKKDTYGFTYQGDSIMNSGWVADPVMIFSAFTGKMLPGTWQLDENGELAYGSIDSENKEALAKMAEWHKNGWLFQEAAATGAWDAMNQFTEGKAGMFMGRPWAVDSVKDVVTVDANAVIKCYPVIAQSSGEATYQSANTNDGYLMFNKDFENMEVFFEYYDWIYDMAFGTGDFKLGYIEGYDYDILSDGSVVFEPTLFDPSVTDPFIPSKTLVTKNQPYVDRMSAYQEVLDGHVDETGAQIKAAATQVANPILFEGYVIANSNKDSQIPNMFNGEPTDTMKKSWEQLQTMEKQAYINIIYGNTPVDSFDQFVEEWNTGGGEQITKEVNDWYKSLAQ